MEKVIFYAIFEKEETGGYSVCFPELEGCYTCGDNFDESLDMEKEALILYLGEFTEKEIEELLENNTRYFEITELKQNEEKVEIEIIKGEWKY